MSRRTTHLPRRKIHEAYQHNVAPRLKPIVKKRAIKPGKKPKKH